MKPHRPHRVPRKAAALPLALSGVLCGALAAAVMAGCARQAPPPGGPEDKIPPLVMGVWPAPNATEVPLESPFLFEFSEWMNERVSSGVALFSPPLRRIPKLEMRAKRLTVVPREPLDSLTTYTVTLQQNLSDLRGNPLPAPFALTFSTGSQIDSLSFEGRVSHHQNTIPQGTMVGLWPLDSNLRDKFSWMREIPGGDSLENSARLKKPINLVQEPPLYRATPDSTGAFLLSGMAPSRYRVAAFVDQNGNSRIEPSAEEAAVATHDIELQHDKRNEPVQLTLSLLDTGLVQLLDGEQLPYQQLQLRFNRPLHRESAFKIENYSVSPADSSHRSAAPQIRAVYPHSTTGAPVLWVQNLLPDHRYTVSVSGLSDSSALGLDTAAATVSLLWNLMPQDTLPESVARFSPAMGATELPPTEPLELWFNGPISDSSEEWLERIRLVSAAETTTVEGEWLSPVQLRLLPPQPLFPGTDYSVQLLSRDTTDGAGKRLPDSLVQTHWSRLGSFKIWEMMKLGSAKVCLPPHPQLKLRLHSLASQKTEQKTGGTDGCALFDPLPEGSYRVESYFDLNSNDRWDAGALEPWHPAEPILRWNDTLKVERGVQQLYQRNSAEEER